MELDPEDLSYMREDQLHDLAEGLGLLTTDSPSAKEVMRTINSARLEEDAIGQ